jgi:hypothetical protein
VQDPGEPHPLDGLGGQAELAGGELREASDALAVRGAARVANVECLGERQERPELHVRPAVPGARRVGEDARYLGARDDRAIATELLGGIEGLVSGTE